MRRPVKSLSASALISLGVLFWIGGCEQGQPERRLSAEERADEYERSLTSPEDRALVQKARLAASRNVAPEAVEDFVGARATLSTLRDQREIMKRASFVGDPDAPEPLLDFADAKQAVYWVRPAEARQGPKLVGILWDEQGQAKLFYGVVLPP
jgi:hypothetical protein